MGKSNKVPETPIEQVDVWLRKRDKHTRIVAKADARLAKRIKKAHERHAEQVGKSPEKIAKLDQQLADFAFENRSWLVLQFSKTINRARGVLRFVQQAPKLEMPKDESEIIAFLEKRRGGAQYLDYRPKINRTRLAGASKDLKRELKRRFGIHYGPHLSVLVKSPIEKQAKTIGEQRNNVWPRQK